MHLSLCSVKTFLCLGFVFLWVQGGTTCSLCHTWLPWGCYRIPHNLRRGRCSKPIETQIGPSFLEVSQNALSLLLWLEGGNSDIYFSRGWCELYCWWGSWKKENAENSVINCLYLPETVASFCTKAKWSQTEFMQATYFSHCATWLPRSFLSLSFPYSPSSKHRRPEHGYINHILTRLL